MNHEENVKGKNSYIPFERTSALGAVPSYVPPEIENAPEDIRIALYHLRQAGVMLDNSKCWNDHGKAHAAKSAIADIDKAYARIAHYLHNNKPIDAEGNGK